MDGVWKQRHALRGIPINPITNEHDAWRAEGVFPHSALMQVAETDTHDDYVVCRGFEPRDGGYRADISVAKPYGYRVAKAYLVGEVYMATLPLGPMVVPTSTPFGPLGQNPGVGDTTTGQPEDLDEDVDLLYDGSGVLIEWMFVCGPPARRCTATAKGAISGGSGTVDNVAPIHGFSPVANSSEELSVDNPHTYDVDDNGKVRIEWNLTEQAWEIYQADCPS